MAIAFSAYSLLSTWQLKAECRAGRTDEGGQADARGSGALVLGGDGASALRGGPGALLQASHLERTKETRGK